MRLPSFVSHCGVPVLSLCLLSGCGKKSDEIAVYRVEKPAAQTVMPMATAADPSSMPMSSAPFAATESTSATQPAKYAWDVPSEWKTLPASGMRAASFSFETTDKSVLDISVVVLSGDAGGLTANINRWRGQIGLADLSDTEVAAGIKELDTAAGSVKTCAFSNPATKQGIAAGILSDEEGAWFFKMSGSDTAVNEGSASFARFLGSLRKNL